MNDTLISEDRRKVRSSLMATLAVVFTLILSALAWARVNPPAAEQTGPTISAAAAAPASAESATEVTDVDPGCGSAEPCVTQAP